MILASFVSMSKAPVGDETFLKDNYIRHFMTTLDKEILETKFSKPPL